MDNTEALVAQDNQSDEINNYQVIKAASFEGHPFIETLGFKNNFVLQKVNSEKGTLKQVSIVLNYRPDKMKAYKKQCKILEKAFSQYFERIDRKKDQLSFSNTETILFFESNQDDPILTLSKKQTFLEVNNPKQAVYSLILTYQDDILD